MFIIYISIAGTLSLRCKRSGTKFAVCNSSLSTGVRKDPCMNNINYKHITVFSRDLKCNY